MTHNTFHKIDKFLKIFWYIRNTYFNTAIIFSWEITIISFAKWNIHWKLWNQALNSFIAASTDLLKLSKFVYTLTMSRCIIHHSEHKQPVSPAVRWGHFRVARISFYIQNPRQFWNSVNTDYKMHSHGYQWKVVYGQNQKCASSS